MKYMKFSFVIALVVLLASGSVLGYELNNLGAAGGWDDINKGGAVTTVLDASDYTLDMASEAVRIALINAYTTWDSVEAATGLTFEFKTDKGGNYDVFDGPNDSAGPPWFDGYSNTLDQNAQWRYANIVMGGWLPESYFGNPNILAVTWTGKLSGGGSRKPTWHSEIFFNDAWAWSDNPGTNKNQIDVETVALHELGHSLGLGHENDKDVPPVMASFYTGVNRTLFADDIDGITALYSGGKSGGGGGKGGGGNGGGKGKPDKLIGGDIDWYLSGVTYYDAVSMTPVPEPATLSLLTLGGLAILRRKRN